MNEKAHIDKQVRHNEILDTQSMRSHARLMDTPVLYGVLGYMLNNENMHQLIVGYLIKFALFYVGRVFHQKKMWIVF